MIEVLSLVAALQNAKPRVDHQRILTISQAVQEVSLKYAPRWKRGERLLAAALLTAALQESGLEEDVHDGSRRGSAGEICLVQIHPKNSAWWSVATSFEELAGVDLESTRKCFQAAAITLIRSANYCWKRRYHRNWVQAMWTSYHYGGRCWLSPHAYERTGIMWRFSAKLEIRNQR